MDAAHQGECCKHPKTTRDEAKTICASFSYVLCTHAEKNLAKFTHHACTDHSDPWFADEAAGSSGHTGPASGSGSSGHTGPASGSGSSGHTGPASGLELGKGHRSWEAVQKILKEKFKGSSWPEIRQNLISADEETQEKIRAELHQDLMKKYPGHSIEEIKKKLTDFRDLLDSDIQQHALQHFDDKCPKGRLKAIKNVLAQLKMEPALEGKSWVIGQLKCDKDATTMDECQCDSLTTNNIPTRPIDIDFENEVPTGTQEFLMVIRGENAESPSVPVSCDVILVEKTDATNTGKHRYKPTYCPSAEETRIRNLEKTVAMLKQEVKETEGTRRRLLSKRRRKLLQSKGCSS